MTTMARIRIVDTYCEHCATRIHSPQSTRSQTLFLSFTFHSSLHCALLYFRNIAETNSTRASPQFQKLASVKKDQHHEISNASMIMTQTRRRRSRAAAPAERGSGTPSMMDPCQCKYSMTPHLVTTLHNTALHFITQTSKQPTNQETKNQ